LLQIGEAIFLPVALLNVRKTTEEINENAAPNISGVITTPTIVIGFISASFSKLVMIASIASSAL
jgi:hypothetical protein